MDDFDDDLAEDDDQLTAELDRLAEPAATAAQIRFQLLQARRRIEDWRDARAMRDDIDYLDEAKDWR